MFSPILCSLSVTKIKQLSTTALEANISIDQWRSQESELEAWWLRAKQDRSPCWVWGWGCWV